VLFRFQPVTALLRDGYAAGRHLLVNQSAYRARDQFRLREQTRARRFGCVDPAIWLFRVPFRRKLQPYFKDGGSRNLDYAKRKIPDELYKYSVSGVDREDKRCIR